jgi:hypothetical protein
LSLASSIFFIGFDFVVMFIASLLDDILYGRYA